MPLHAGHERRKAQYNADACFDIAHGSTGAVIPAGSISALAAAAAASSDQRIFSDACDDDHRRVIVAGAGLAGLATAAALHKVLSAAVAIF